MFSACPTDDESLTVYPSEYGCFWRSPNRYTYSAAQTHCQSYPGKHHVTYIVTLPSVAYPPPLVAWRWSDYPVVCSAAMRSLHCAGSSATATGFVHKSRGDNYAVRLCNTTVL